MVSGQIAQAGRALGASDPGGRMPMTAVTDLIGVSMPEALAERPILRPASSSDRNCGWMTPLRS